MFTTVSASPGSRRPIAPLATDRVRPRANRRSRSSLACRPSRRSPSVRCRRWSPPTASRRKLVDPLPWHAPGSLLAVAGTLVASLARLLQHLLLVLGGRQLRPAGPGRAHVLALGRLVVGAQDLLLVLARRHAVLDGPGGRAGFARLAPRTRGDTVAGGAAGLLALVLRHGCSRAGTKGEHDRKGGGRQVVSTRHG